MQGSNILAFVNVSFWLPFWMFPEKKEEIPDMAIRYGIIVSSWFFLMVNSTQPRFAESLPRCKAWLVQSIPTGMPDLRRVPGVLSTAQYWQLKATPEDYRSGGYGYSNADMRRFGADQGFDVYTALENAADRDVDIRFIQHSGVHPDYTKEPSSLASGRPNVQSVTLLLEKWWVQVLSMPKFGSRITETYISDRRTTTGNLLLRYTMDHTVRVQDVLIMAEPCNNMSWLWSQVKEVGIYIVGCPKVARKVGVYFQNLWRLAHLDDSVYTTTISDQQWQIQRKVPCWSHFIESDLRCMSQLPRFVEIPYAAGYPTLSDPKILKLIIDAPGYGYRSLVPQSSCLSFAPPELSFGRFQPDEQGWLDTIKLVGDGGTVRISTMDCLGQSQYMNQTVYWSVLSTAVSEVPGYSSTGPAVKDGKPTGNLYPAFPRVNHGKYAVSDVHAHIGTSNLIWDYFYTTADVSFGTYNPAIVSQLRDIFDADWNSPYAVPVEELSDGHTCSS
ncbi:Enoyl-CoA hydratase [Hibiscus syriacus]|uniref:Enoyl-CoA hydratase n=1 Tax=Hibiscus syriacus TaxID=106335 RepID=A0A6A3BV80_HIBSY|nr:Enoyl-CoA hydratase [Hibiscus syriacus]